MSENMKNETGLTSEKETETKKVTSTEKTKAAPKTKKPNVFSKLGGLFKGSWRELKHVTWSSKRSTTMNSILVVVTLILVGAIFGLFDIGFSKLLTFVMDLY